MILSSLRSESSVLPMAAPVEEVKSEEKPESEKKVDEDDNDLYSLRNFGI